MAENVDLEVSRKTTKVYELRFTVKATGSAEDITGWTIYFTAKTSLKDIDDNAVIKHTITDHIDAVGGKTLIEFQFREKCIFKTYKDKWRIIH